MHVDAGLRPQEAEVVEGLAEILASLDPLADRVVEGLDPDLELEAAGRKTGDKLAQPGREAIGDHLKVDEEVDAAAYLVEEELEDRRAAGEVEVEGPVDELEAPRAAGDEPLEGFDEPRQGEGADLLVERGEAELAAVGAAAGGLDVEHPLAEIVVAVELVGQGERLEIGETTVDDPLERAPPGEEARTELREGALALAADDVVDVGEPGLVVDLVADLRTADDDGQRGRQAAEELDDLPAELDVPDVDAEADDPRLVGEDGLDDVDRPELDRELEHRRLAPQRAHVGEEVAQAEGGVGVLRVECRQDDRRHGDMVAAEGRRRRSLGPTQVGGGEAPTRRSRRRRSGRWPSPAGSRPAP